MKVVGNKDLEAGKVNYTIGMVLLTSVEFGKTINLLPLEKDII